MFTLTVYLVLADLESIKAELTRGLGDVKSSHRCQAIARGLGLRTYESLLSAVAGNQPVSVTADGSAFREYLRERDFHVPVASFYRAVARVAIRHVLEKEVRLTHSGIGVGRPRRKPDGNWEDPREQYARLLREREELLDDGSVDEFLRSLAFLRRVLPTRTIRTDRSSYNLKHIAEKFSCTYPEGDKLGPDYVANGSFIAAAMHAGFDYKTYRDDLGYEVLSVNFNMAKARLDELDCEIRPDGSVAQARRYRQERRSIWRGVAGRML